MAILAQILVSKSRKIQILKLDDLDQAILKVLSGDARATYSEISKAVGVSITTVRNRITAMRDSGSLHLRVWLDPHRAGIGLAATFLLRVRPNRLEQVTQALIALDATGYIATLAGDHDLLVDAFCRDVSHLEHVLHKQIQAIDGVRSVTSYLVTDIKYDSDINIAGLLNGADAATGDESGQVKRNRSR